MSRCWLKLLRSDDQESVKRVLTDLYEASIEDGGVTSAAEKRQRYLETCFNKPESIIQRAVLDFWDEMRSAQKATAARHIEKCQKRRSNGEACKGQYVVSLIRKRVYWVQCEEDERRKEERLPAEAEPGDREDEGSHSRLVEDAEASQDLAGCLSRIKAYFAELVSPELSPDMYEIWRLKYGEEWSYSDLYENRYETVQGVADRLGRTIGSADVLGQFMREINGYMKNDPRLEPYVEFLKND